MSPVPPVGPRELRRRQLSLRSYVGRQIAETRAELGASRSVLARCTGLDVAYVRRIELGVAHPSLDALVAISTCLGTDLGVRLFPGAGPRIHDRLQAPMIEALIGFLGTSWRAQPEVVVPAARGVVDLVLRRESDGCVIACECHSELRRLELVLRRLAEKREALNGELSAGRPGELSAESSAARSSELRRELSEVGQVSSLLLLRSTAATRAIARAYQATLAAAFPARAVDALAALQGDAAWPGPAIIWARVSGGRAEIIDGVPRGVPVGR